MPRATVNVNLEAHRNNPELGSGSILFEPFIAGNTLKARLAIIGVRHAAGMRYFDFTPVMIVALASVVGARYLAIGTGDTELYIFAGMVAAVVISLRVFLFKGAGKAN